MISSDSYHVLLHKIYRNISIRSKKRLITILITIGIGATLDLIVISTTLLFLSSLAGDFSQINNNTIYQFFNTSDPRTAYMYMCILFILVILLSSLVKISFLRLNFNSSAYIGKEIATLCFEKAISDDFEKQQLINSSVTLNLLVTNVDATTAAINNVLLLTSSIASSITIISGIIFINYRLSILLIITVLFIYILIIKFSKNKFKRLGEQLQKTGIKRNKIIQESRGALRDIILSNAIPYITNYYAKNERILKLAGAESLFLSSYPRQVLEFTGLSLIGFIALVNYDQKGLIVTLGTFVLAIQRLLPNVQSIYMTWAGLKARYPAVKEVVGYMESPIRNSLLPNGFIAFESLELKDVCYSYPGNKEKPVLKNINIKIERGDKIGIVGASGSGKSTLLDIIMLLLAPSSGKILLNGKEISFSGNNKIRTQWMNSIGHVPQDIFLIDDTIENNIKLDFGSSGTVNEITESKIIKSAKLARIHELIKSLPLQYKSVVGERGTLLSGGQKQRLGIARALYKANGFLIFDEATSALDNTTEREIIDNIFSSTTEQTLIMVAHRQNTLKHCNHYFRIEDGVIFKLNSLEEDD